MRVDLCFGLAGVLLMACHSAVSSPPPENSMGTVGMLPICGASSVEVAPLESYRALSVPGTYWVDMEKGAHREWWPTEHRSMQFHQSVRIELSNVHEIGALASHESDTVRFTLGVERRQQRALRGRPEVRVTFVARILTLCIPHVPPVDTCPQ